MYVSFQKLKHSFLSAGAIAYREPIDNFALLDHEGKFHELYYYSYAKAIVLVVHGIGCPIMGHSFLELQQLKEKYTSKGVVFFLINANPQDDRTALAENAKELGITMPILKDEAQLVSAALKVTRTAEAFVIDPKSKTIVYRGPIDDRLNYGTQKAKASRHYLADALKSFLEGNPLNLRIEEVKGCLINLNQPAEKISYVRQVAPILKEKCMSCHIAGGIAPWAMTDYEKVRGWAPMIREVIRTKRMPPWHADPLYGEFSNDRSLSVEEQRTLVHWIEAGASRDEGKDSLPEWSAKPVSRWPLGKPDLVIPLPPQEIPATGILDYRYAYPDFEVPEDLWLRAYDVQPSNHQAIMHHIFIFFAREKSFYEKTMGEREKMEFWQKNLAAVFAVGKDPYVYPAGIGRFIPKGTKFVVEIHYVTTGKSEVDLPEIGFYLHSKPQPREMRYVFATNEKIKIPPHDPFYKTNAQYTLPYDFDLYFLAPHMHFRGRWMEFNMAYPDGSEEKLLSVPNYDSNWQRNYLLKQPKRLPAGTVVNCVGAFDNSSHNPVNPDPNRTVQRGPFTTDEMFLCIMGGAQAGESSQNKAMR